MTGTGLLRGVISLDSTWQPSERRRLVLDGLAGTKLYGPDMLDSSGDENAAIASGGARYEETLPSRELSLAALARYYDSVHLGSAPRLVEPRHFSVTSAGLGLTVMGPAQHRLILGGGYRRFHDKADQRFDWQGDRYGLRFHTTRWRGNPDEDLDAAVIDLDISYDVQRRYHDRDATGFRRVDLFHGAAIQAVYTGDRIYSGLYELQVTDSNTVGFSFVRQRLRLGVTTELFARLYMTAEATLQLDLLLDQVLLDPRVRETIDDENRNSLSVHLGRSLSKAWTVELRYALYINEFAGDSPRYLRHVVYSGLLYQRSR